MPAKSVKFSINSNFEQLKIIHGHRCSTSMTVDDLELFKVRIYVPIESEYAAFVNSDFGRISYRFRDIDAFSSYVSRFHHPTLVWRRLAKERPAIST